MTGALKVKVIDVMPSAFVAASTSPDQEPFAPNALPPLKPKTALLAVALQVIVGLPNVFGPVPKSLTIGIGANVPPGRDVITAASALHTAPTAKIVVVMSAFAVPDILNVDVINDPQI